MSRHTLRRVAQLMYRIRELSIGMAEVLPELRPIVSSRKMSGIRRSRRNEAENQGLDGRLCIARSVEAAMQMTITPILNDLEADVLSRITEERWLVLATEFDT
jgi:hypothetical protein